MKLRLPSKLVAAIMATASTTVLTTLCTGSSAYAEGEAPAAVKNGETLGNVMYIGDSITNGHGGMVSWRWQFFKMLTDNGISQTEQGINTGRFTGSYHTQEFVNQTYGGVTFENIHSGFSSGRAYEIANRPDRTSGRYDGTNIMNWLGVPDSKTNNGATYDTSTRPVYDEAHGNAINTFFLLIGTNDLLSDPGYDEASFNTKYNKLLGWDNSSETFTGHIGETETKPDIEVIYNTMKEQAPSANIVMLTIPTTGTNSGGASGNSCTPEKVAGVMKYNELLTQWVNDKNAGDGPKINLIDINKGIIDVTNSVPSVSSGANGACVENSGVAAFFNDGLHPSAQGELIIAGNVAKGMGIGGRTAGLVRSSAATDTALWTSAAETSYTLSSGTLNFAENAFTTENGYTVDFGAVFGDGAANTWLDSSNALSITIGDGSNTGTLNISEGYIMWGSNILYSQDNHSNSEKLRIAYHNGVTADNVAGGYYVWLGDMLIGEGLTATTGSGLLNGITLGATGAAGTVSNLTWADTAYAPTTNFYMNEAAAYTAVQEVTRAISVAAGATENINVETIASSFSMGANSTLNIGKDVTVQSGATISVTDSMRLTIAEGAKLTLTGTDVGSDDYTKSTKFAYIMDAATGDGTIQLNGDTYVQLGNNASPFSTPHVFKTNYHVTGDMALQDWKHTDNGTADNDNPWVIGANAENQGSLTVDGKLWVSNGQHLEVSEYGSLNVTGNVELGLISTWHYTGFLDVLGGEATLGSIKFLSNNAAFNMSGGVLRVTNSNAFDTASVTNPTATTISAGTLKAEGNSWVFNRTATIGGADSTVTVVTDATHSITLGANGTTTTLAGDINVGAPGIAMMSEDGDGSSAQSGNLVLDGAYNGGAHAVNVLSGSSLAFGSNLAVADGSSITVNGETGAYVHLTQNTMPTRVTLGNAENWQGTVKLTNVALSGDSGKELSTLGNANSTVELTGVTGYDHNWAHTFGTQTANIRLTDEGDTLAWVYSGGGTNGTSKYYMNNTGKWSGEGTFKVNMATAPVYNGFRYSGDVSEWTGTFEMAAGTADLWFRDQADTVNATIAKSGGTLNLYVGTAADDKAAVTFNKAVTANTLTVFGTATFKEALTLNSNATVADGNTVILAGNAATVATLEKFNGIGGTVQLGDGSSTLTLTLGDKQYTANTIVVGDGVTLNSGWHNSNNAGLSKNVVVSGGGKLQITAGDVLGWGSNGTQSITLNGTSTDKTAELKVSDKQTFTTTLNLNGNSTVTKGNENSALEMFVNQSNVGTINVTGTNNTIASKVWLRGDGSSTTNLTTADGAELTISGDIDVSRNGSYGSAGSLTKKGNGTLNLTGTNVFQKWNNNPQGFSNTDGGFTNEAGTTNFYGSNTINSLNVTGGTVHVGVNPANAEQSGSVTVMKSANVANGTELTIDGGLMHVKNDATLTIDGGAVTVSGNGKLQLGQINNSNGNLVMNSGSLTATHIDAAFGGNAKFQGGVVEFTGGDETGAIRKDPVTKPGHAVNVTFNGTATDNLVLKATQSAWKIDKPNDISASKYPLTLGNFVVDAGNTHLISFIGAEAAGGSSTITNNSLLKLKDFTIGANNTITLTGEGVTTLGSAITNNGTLSLSGTVNLDYAASSTGTDYTYGLTAGGASATGNGYKYASANYQVVNSAGNAATAADGIAWQVNGDAVSNATFDGKVLSAGAARVDSNRYHINTGGDISFGAQETATHILFRGEQAGTTGTTTLTVDGAGSLTSPILLSRVNNSDQNGGYNKDHILNLTLDNGAVVKIDNHSGGYAEANGNIAVNAGSTLVLATTDTLGYNDRNNGDQTKNLTLTGSADKTATVLLKNRQTMHTNLNLNGDTLITNTSDAEATGGDLAGLESLGGKITATGQNNIIDTRLMINWSMTIDVQGLDGELEVSGRTYNRTGGDKVTKTGAGTLTFSYSSESDKNVFHGNGLDVKEGTVNLNSDTLLNGALAIGAAASGSNPATTATVNIGEGAEIILHGGSITAGSTLNNAGTMVFESTSNAGNVDLFKAATGTGNAVIKTDMAVGNNVQPGLTGNLTVTNGATLDLATAKAQPTKLGWTSGSENKGFSSVTLAGGIISSDSTLGIVRNLTTTENTTGNKIHFRDFPDSYSSNPTNFSGTTTLNSDLEIYTEYKSQLNFDHLTGSGNLSLTTSTNRSDNNANVTINSVDGYTGTLKLVGATQSGKTNQPVVTLSANADRSLNALELNHGTLNLFSSGAGRTLTLNSLKVTGANNVIAAAQAGYHGQVDIADLSSTAAGASLEFKNAMVDRASVLNINGGEAGAFDGTLHLHQIINGGTRHIAMNVADADVLSKAVISMESENISSAHVALGIAGDSVTVKGITTDSSAAEKVIFSGAAALGAQSYNSDGTDRTLVINTAGGEYTANATVKSNLSITKEGEGTQTFSGSMTAFNGNLTVNAGTLAFTNAVTVAAERTVTMGGGTLTFGSGATISGATTLGGTSLLNFTGGNSTMTGAISAADTSTVALSNNAALTVKDSADKALPNVTFNGGTMYFFSQGAGRTYTLHSVAVTGANNTIATANDNSSYHAKVNIENLSSVGDGAELNLVHNAKVDVPSVFNINGGADGAFNGILHLKQNQSSTHNNGRHVAMNINDADVLSNAVISMESENNSTSHVALGVAVDGATVKGITTADTNGEKVIFSGSAVTDSRNYNGDDTTRTLVINTGDNEETIYTANATIKSHLNLTKDGAGKQEFIGTVSDFNGKINVTNGTLAFTGLTSNNTLSIGSNLTTDEGNAKVSGSGALVAGKATFTAKGEAATMDAEGDAPATNTGTIANAVFKDSSLSGTLGKGSLSNGLLAIAEDVTYSISEMTLNNSVVAATANGAVLNMQNVSIDAASSVEANSGALTGSNRLTLSDTQDVHPNTVLQSAQMSGLTLQSDASLAITLNNTIGADLTNGAGFTITLSGFQWEDLVNPTSEPAFTLESLNNTFTVIAMVNDKQVNFEVINAQMIAATGSAPVALQLTVVPEPTTGVLSLLALAGMAARRKRK